MSIGSICSTFVATVEEEATLSEASQRMRENHVGSLVVTKPYDGRQIPCGIITDRDLALVMGTSPNPQNLHVKQLMRAQPIVIAASEGVFETMVRMRENGIKRLPVVDEGGFLVGIVCADDLLSLLAKEFSFLARIGEVQTRHEQTMTTPQRPQLHA